MRKLLILAALPLHFFYNSASAQFIFGDGTNDLVLATTGDPADPDSNLPTDAVRAMIDIQSVKVSNEADDFVFELKMEGTFQNDFILNLGVLFHEEGALHLSDQNANPIDLAGNKSYNYRRDSNGEGPLYSRVSDNGVGWINQFAPHSAQALDETTVEIRVPKNHLNCDQGCGYEITSVVFYRGRTFMDIAGPERVFNAFDTEGFANGILPGPQQDLSIKKNILGNPANVIRGQEVTYVITVENQGTETERGLSILEHARGVDADFAKVFVPGSPPFDCDRSIGQDSVICTFDIPDIAPQTRLILSMDTRVTGRSLERNLSNNIAYLKRDGHDIGSDWENSFLTSLDERMSASAYFGRDWEANDSPKDVYLNNERVVDDASDLTSGLDLGERQISSLSMKIELVEGSDADNSNVIQDWTGAIPIINDVVSGSNNIILPDNSNRAIIMERGVSQLALANIDTSSSHLRVSDVNTRQVFTDTLTGGQYLILDPIPSDGLIFVSPEDESAIRWAEPPSVVIVEPNSLGFTRGEFSLRVFRADGSPISFQVVTDSEKEELPEKGITLSKNYPNPFGAKTHIRYFLTELSPVDLSIYDASGRLIRNLVDGEMPQGNYLSTWDGKDDSGKSVANGLYIYRLEAGSQSQIQTMLLTN